MVSAALAKDFVGRAVLDGLGRSVVADRKKESLAEARARRIAEALAAQSEADDGDGPMIQYRGQRVRSGGTRPSRRVESAKSTEVDEALRKVKELYQQGLISRKEAEEKRAEIIDRL